MKISILLAILLVSAASIAQTPLPHGAVYGTKPSTIGMVNAIQLETFMGKKVRISTTIKGNVLKVTKQKGGWLNIDAGNGRIIAAHFKNYAVTIPVNLQGKTIIAEGVAQKEFIADDMQTFAGDTVKGKKQHSVKTNPKKRLTFEIKGLMVVN